MGAITRLIADLLINNAGFNTGLGSSENRMSRFRLKMARDLTAVSRSFESATSRVLGIEGALAGLVSGTSLVFLSKNALNTADAFAKMSDRIGASVVETQRWVYAAKLSGVETEQLETALGFLNRQLADGKLPYKTINQALEDLAERTVNARDGIERARIATEAFGAKGGARLIPFLMQGKDGLKALGDEAARLGIILDETTVRNAEQFKDQLEILGDVISRNFQQGLLSGFAQDSDEIRDIYTDQGFIDGIKSIGEAFGELAHFVIVSVKAFQDAKVALAALGIGVASKFNKNSPFAIDPEVAQFALEDAGTRLNGPAVGGFTKPRTGGTGTGSAGEELKAAQERLKVIGKINDELTRESVIIGTQVTHYGEKESLIKRAIKAKEIELKLAEEGVTLTEQERQQIRMKLDLLYENMEQLEVLEAQQKKNEEIGKQLGLTFSSAFEDAIVEGKSLRDVLKGIESDIIRLMARKLITEPAAAGLSSIFSGGGGFMDIIGGLFGLGGGGTVATPGASFGMPVGQAFTALPWLGGFASGIDTVPMDGLAMIHKNEAVLNEDDAASWRSGAGSNLNVNMYISTPNADSFRASQAQILTSAQSQLEASARRFS